MCYNINIITFKGHQTGTHFQLCNKRQDLGGIKCTPIVTKTNYSNGIRKHYTRIFALNNHELDKASNSLRNLIHGIIRCLLKLSYLCSGINATSQFIKHFAFKNSGKKNYFISVKSKGEISNVKTCSSNQTWCNTIKPYIVESNRFVIM